MRTLSNEQINKKEMNVELFKNLFNQLLCKIDYIESFETEETRNFLKITVEFREHPDNIYTYRKDGTYSLVEFLNNLNAGCMPSVPGV